MKRTNNRKGFTLAEVLIVVGILVVLMAVGFIALTSHARNMHQLEMDGQAKEIFVAAQNHLTMAESQGYMGISATSDTDVTTFGVTADAEKGIYYYVVGGEGAVSPDVKGTALNQMLPFASVDEAARTGGSYIIRYQKSPAVILDVFYVNKTGNYSLKDGFGSGDYATLMGTSPNYREDKSARKDFNKAIIGYYGGASASEIIRSSVSLVAPTVEVINAEKLLVKVTNTNDAQSAEDAAAEKRINLTLVITSVDGKAKKRIDLITNGDPDYTYTPTGGTSGRDFEITLDSVDSEESHFTKLAATGGANMREFIPGEDLLIQAIVYNNNVATNIADSGTDRVNSLFESYDSKTGKVTVSNLRHLLNLDPAISRETDDVDEEDIVKFNFIEQTSDMSWTTFRKNLNVLNHVSDNTTPVSIVNTSGTSTKANSIMPVKLTGASGEGLITYDGKDHKISDIIVDTDAEYYAGLFSELNYVTVQNLELVDFNITLSGSGALAAGALAGTASNATITGVLVHNTQGAPNSLQIQSTGTAAGGLVGSLTGTSTVDKCAAAVYVSAAGDAGGLIGTASGATITDSYAGGHTKDGKYTDLPKEGISAVSVDYVRINVISSGGNAGGLIGSAANSTIQYCYSTASAYGEVPSGLIGSAGSSTIEYCYASGKLFKADGTRVLPFVGAGYASDTFNSNYYLSNVSDLADDYTTIEADEIEGVSSGNTSKTKFIVETKMEADVYDKTLLVDHAGRYVFPTIEQLHTLNGSTWTVTSAFINSFTQRHFGDFQVPGLSPLNYTFVNEHTLYSDVTLESDTQKVTVAVYGEHSTNARVFILDVIRNDSTKAIEKLCVSKEGIVASGAASGSISWLNTTDFTIGTKNDDDGKYYVPVKTSGGKTTFHLTLDDITEEDGHFTQLFNKGDAALSPGENVTLLVGGGEGSWTELKDLKETTWASLTAAEKEKAEAAGQSATYNSCAKTENSLFGPMSSGNAQIVYYRHLQNLDVDVSDAGNCVNAATFALAGATNKVIQWSTLTAGSTETTTYSEIFNKDGSAYVAKPETGSLVFSGIRNDQLTTLSGENYTIVGMPIEEQADFHKFDDSDKNNAGFFRYVNPQNKDEKDEDDEEEGESYTFTISNLHLQDVSVSSDSGNAGAFAAEIASGKSLKLDTVLAEGSAAEIKSTGGAAGGLVGLANGSATIENSAASVLVTANGAAGGLIGQQAAGTADIKNSYVGGHTTGGKYSATDWNIVSATGAAGGIVGELSAGSTAKITRTFNTASVCAASTNAAGGVVGLANGTFASDSGKILDLVYVIAPVSDVKTISGYTFVQEEGEDDGYWAPIVSEENEGNAGSLIGSSAYEIDTAGSGFYFLPGIYTTPLPSDITLTNEDGSKTYKTNIKYIGDGTVTNVRLASYYMEEGGDNSLIGIKHEADLLEERTSAFDAEIKDRFEFPFAIWTTFSFEDSSPIRYFYGDWQPVLDENSKKLHVHFRAQIAKTDGTAVEPSAATVSELNARGMELAVQIPYRELEILLPYAASIDEFGFHISEWDLYYGDQTTGTLVNKTEGTLEAINASSGSLTLTASQFSNALQYGLESDKDPHITIVAKYSENTETTYKLQLWDWDKDAEPLGSTYKASGSYMVLKAKNADGSAMLLKTALEEKGLANQMPTLPGYRFRGWYTQQGGNGTRVYATRYDSTKKAFVSEYGEYPGSDTETVAGPVNLYAWYEPVPKQAIELDFYLKVGTASPAQYGSYEFEFDAEKGFDANLPYPGENFKYVSQQKVAGTATITNDDTNSALHIVVAPSGELHSDPDKIQYNVTFEGSADLRGYVVLYELQHTKKDGDSYSYFLSTNSNASSSCVEQFSTGGEGTTKKDSRPKIDTSKYSAPTVGFTFVESNTYDLTDTENPIPAIYADKYPDSVAAGTGTDAPHYTVQYVVVLTYTREKYELNFNSDGGTTYDPVRVEFDEPLYEKYLKNKTPVYGETVEDAPYTFKWWSMPGQETNIANANPAERMPRKNLTVKAQKEGKPVAFKVAFWYENPDDDDYSFAGMKAYAANAASPAESGTSVKKAGNEISSSYFTDVNFDGKDNSIHGHFTYNSGKNEMITLKGDGSSVLNVYFTRNKVTVTFSGYVYSSTNASTVIGDLQSNNPNDYVYKDGNQVYPVDLADNLPVIKTTHTYTPDNTITSGTTYYGIVNGEYVELSIGSTETVYEWKPQFTYSVVYNRNTSRTDYGVVGEEYVPLTYGGRSDWYYSNNGIDTVYYGDRYKKNGNNYTLANDNQTNNRYGYIDGKYVAITYDNHYYWYYWTYDGELYSWCQAYDSIEQLLGGTHYSQSTYTGEALPQSTPRYVKTGSTFVSTNGTDIPQYYHDGNAYVPLNREDKSTYTWTYEDAAGATKTYPSTSQRYTRSDTGSTYTGAIYTKSSTGYTSVANTTNLDWENVEYYGVDANGGHQRLRKTTMTGLIWYDEDGVAHVYTGTGNDFYRFTNSGSSSVTMTWRGKWQAKFSTYHFDWTMIDKYMWSHSVGPWWSTSSTTITYLDAFVMSEYDDPDYQNYNLSCSGPNGTNEIRHYRQTLNGDYVDDPAIAYTTSDGIIKFTFTNKFNEFEVSSYDTREVLDYDTDWRGNPYNVQYGSYPTFSMTGGSKTTHDEDSHTSEPYDLATPLYIYHERRSYNLTFISGTQTFGPYQVKYDRPFTEDEVRSVVPAESSLNSLGEGYEFQGWCLAATMTGQTIDFGEGIKKEPNSISMEMPSGNLVIYAKWTRPDKTVTFTLGNGETMTAPERAITVEHGATIESYVSENNGWKSEYTPTTTNLDANGNEQVFEKWVYVKAGAEKEFFRSQAVTTDLELKPKWKAKEKPETSQVTVYYVKQGTPADKLEDEAYVLQAKKTYSLPIGDPIDETAPAITKWTPTGDSWVSRTAKKAKETVIFYYESSEWTYTVNYYVRLQSLNEDDQEDWVPGTYEQTPYTETEPIKTSDPDDPPTADDRFTLVTIESIPGYRLEEVEYPDGTETKTSKDAIIFLSKGNNVVVNAYVVPDASTVFEQTVFSSQYAGTPQGLDSLVTPPEGIDLHYLYYQNGTLLKNSDNEPIQPENAGVYGVRAYATRTIGGKTYLIWQSEDVDGKPGIAFYITRRDVEITSPSVTNVFARTSENLNLFEVVDGVYKPKADSGLPNDAVLGGIARNQSTPSYTVPAGLNVTLSFAYSADSFRRTSSGSVDDYTPNVFSYRVTRGDESNFNFYLTFGKLYVWDKLSTYQAYLASLTPAQPETPADP